MAFGDFIKSGKDTTGAFKTTYTPDLGSNPTSGNLLIVAFVADSSGNTLATPPSGFTLLQLNNGGNDSWTWFFKISDGTEQTATGIWTTSRSGTGLYAEYEWDGSTPTVTKNEDATNVSTIVNSQPSGAATPTTTTNVCIAMHGSGSGVDSESGQAIDGSWVEDLGFAVQGAADLKFSSLVNAATSSQEATHSDTDVGEDMYGAIAIFDAAAAAGIQILRRRINGEA